MDTTKQQLTRLYSVMYQAMIDKDIATLDRLHAPSFVLTHMTGMTQSKDAYLKAIARGTLNYYSAIHNDVTLDVQGNTATLRGRSTVEAAVFGGGKHTWKLQLLFTIEKNGDNWVFTSCRASTW